MRYRFSAVADITILAETATTRLPCPSGPLNAGGAGKRADTNEGCRYDRSRPAERRGARPPPRREDGEEEGRTRQDRRQQDRGARARHRAYRQGQGEDDGGDGYGDALHRSRHEG